MEGWISATGAMCAYTLAPDRHLAHTHTHMHTHTHTYLQRGARLAALRLDDTSYGSAEDRVQETGSGSGSRSAGSHGRSRPGRGRDDADLSGNRHHPAPLPDLRPLIGVRSRSRPRRSRRLRGVGAGVGVGGRSRRGWRLGRVLLSQLEKLLVRRVHEELEELLGEQSDGGCEHVHTWKENSWGRNASRRDRRGTRPKREEAT